MIDYLELMSQGFHIFDWTDWYSDALWMLQMILVAEKPEDHTHVWYHVIFNRASNFVILLKADYSCDFDLLQWNCCFENCCCDGWRSRYKLSVLGAPTDGPCDVFCADNWVLFPAHPDQKSLLKNKHCSDAYYTAREWIAAGILNCLRRWQDQHRWYFDHNCNWYCVAIPGWLLYVKKSN